MEVMGDGLGGRGEQFFRRESRKVWLARLGWLGSLMSTTRASSGQFLTAGGKKKKKEREEFNLF